VLFVLVVVGGLAGAASATAPPLQEHGEAAASHGGHPEIGAELPLWTVLPFLGILLSIAIFPLVAADFWHHHFPKVSALWALVFAIPFLLVYGDLALYEILHIFLADYFPFIILLWALFTVAGGVHVKGTLSGKPAGNLMLLLVGTLIASWIGTTGAAMVMIRPLLRANAHRRHKVHIVCFFIFLVANIGGSLTPLGDPPLFLGFLHHVPFFWTFHLLPHMGFVSLVLLAVFFALDSYYHRKEGPRSEIEEKTPIRIEGAINILFLLGIIGGVLMSGTWRPGEFAIWRVHVGIQNLVRDGWLVLMGMTSLAMTPRRLREANEFSWFPIQEVAYLFAGIFMTMIPALAILRAGEHGAAAFLIHAVKEPHHYFWVTGILSSFLDNAPTYLTFLNTALGQFFAGLPEPQGVAGLIGERKVFLEAIAAGAVFMGANSYIGNAPNFMVRSIAEEAGIPMPSFFGYMLRYSIPFLVPIFIVVTLIFF